MYRRFAVFSIVIVVAVFFSACVVNVYVSPDPVGIAIPTVTITPTVTATPTVPVTSTAELDFSCTPFAGEQPETDKAPVNIDGLVSNLPAMFQSLPLNRNRAIAYVYGVSSAEGALTTVPLLEDCQFANSQFGRIVGAVENNGGATTDSLPNPIGVVSIAQDPASDAARGYYFYTADSNIMTDTKPVWQEFEVQWTKLEPTDTAEGSLTLDSSIRLDGNTNIACYRYIDRRYCFPAAILPDDAARQLHSTVEIAADILRQRDIVPAEVRFAADRAISEIENTTVMQECPNVGTCTTDLVAAPVAPESSSFRIDDLVVAGLISVARPIPTEPQLAPGVYLVLATPKENGRLAPPGKVKGLTIPGFDPTNSNPNLDQAEPVEMELAAEDVPYYDPEQTVPTAEITSWCLGDFCPYPQNARRRR